MNNEIFTKMNEALNKYDSNVARLFELQSENRSIKQFLIGEVLKHQQLAERVLTLNTRQLHNLINRM